MREQDWIPAHRRLFKGAKKGWPRAVRFVLLELCHEARVTAGVLDFPPEWDTLEAVHDRIGGDRREIRKALTLLQIPDATGAQVIQIERDLSGHSLKIVKWEDWVGPKSSSERVQDHRKRLLEKALALHPANSVTPRVEERKEEERREEPAPESEVPPEQPQSETRLKSVPPAPPDPVTEQTETGYDLAYRLWHELWSAKYKRPYEQSGTRLTGPGSEDSVLVDVGGRALIRGDRAEAYLRHKIAAYLRDEGDRKWLVEHCHPLRTLTRDWAKYGDPKPPARMVPRRAEEPAEPVSAERQAEFAKQVAAVGRGGAG